MTYQGLYNDPDCYQHCKSSILPFRASYSRQALDDVDSEILYSLIAREHNPANQPTVEYEPAAVTTASHYITPLFQLKSVQRRVWVRKHYHHDPENLHYELDTGYTQTNTSTISGIRTCGRLHCRLK
ncbi:hypothetical protein T01_11749 [Trichinella spiralis]|uniref:Uncharacterized protein n=1 Tax=Trichinella spiralis TaxID=6334 RepID=A0A0V1BDB6_TRISP|nr:hypothetical protein T01_11749 [Trichinella spiralis]